MTKEAAQLMAEALKTVKLNHGFCPVRVGAKAGLTKPQAETAARALSNAGILVLGFDFSAEFSSDYRKAHAPPSAVAAGKNKKKALRTKLRRKAVATAE